MIRKYRIFAFFLLCFQLPFLQAGGFEIDKLFPQKILSSQLKELVADKQKCLSIFLTNPEDYERPIVLNFLASIDEKYFVLRGKLTPIQTNYLVKSIINGRPTPFKGFRIDGSVFYEKGMAKVSRLKFKDSEIKVVFVPYIYKSLPNESFTSDLGYLQLKILIKDMTNHKDVSKVIKKAFLKPIKLCKQVKKNRYFLLRDNYYGLVNYFFESPLNKDFPKSSFYPIHKLTLNKNVKDWNDKIYKDAKLISKILLEDEYLYSQDERTKRGWVPSFVKLNPKRVAQTDIGSGQNNIVFLTIGPGINYFDDPWQTTRVNVPCPRLIFSKLVYCLEEAQYYPSYSIDPTDDGNGRLFAINKFQQPGFGSNYLRRLLWMKEPRKSNYFSLLDKSLCKYGVLNDSPELEPGFVFMKEKFRGNLVNNEVRINQSIGVKEFLQGIIIPKGSKQTFLNAMEGADKNFGFMRTLNKLIIEAPFSTDKGFRIAYLGFLLKETHPEWYRLYKLAFNKKHALEKLMEKISRNIEKTGPDFFNTAYYRAYSELKKKRLIRWLDYLEAKRENCSTQIASKFMAFNKLMGE